jgi:endonuclease/exonuclease/phosphatase family metal-dependent hydrolase
VERLVLKVTITRCITIGVAGTALALCAFAACRSGEPRLSPPGSTTAMGVPPAAPTSASKVEASPWSSPEACAAAVARGERAQRGSGRVRIGTWNVRWFPDGRPGKQASDPGSDVAWLACAIAWLDVDVLVVQEFKTHERARRRTQELLQRIDASTGGSWAAKLDECPHPAGQHVGLLFDRRRVRASAGQTYPSINPHGDACRDQLRPGFGAYLRFTSGLDLHVLSVHLKSGQNRRDFELRRRSLQGVTAALAQARGVEADEDVLVAGDFNSMGCARCSPGVAAEAELVGIDGALSSHGTRLRRVSSQPGCSHYFGGRPTLLDFFVAASLAELPAERTATAHGPCAEHACGDLRREQRPTTFAERLSDHCPVVIELDGTDKD